MVDFQLDEMQLMLRELAHEFAVDEIRPKAEHWDLNSEYPKEAINAAHEMGLLNLHISEDYGGPGLGIMEEVLVNEELAGTQAASGSAAVAAPSRVAAFEEWKKSPLDVPRFEERPDRLLGDPPSHFNTEAREEFLKFASAIANTEAETNKLLNSF